MPLPAILVGGASTAGAVSTGWRIGKAAMAVARTAAQETADWAVSGISAAYNRTVGTAQQAFSSPTNQKRKHIAKQADETPKARPERDLGPRKGSFLARAMRRAGNAAGRISDAAEKGGNHAAKFSGWLFGQDLKPALADGPGAEDRPAPPRYGRGNGSFKQHLTLNLEVNKHQKKPDQAPGAQQQRPQDKDRGSGI